MIIGSLYGVDATHGAVRMEEVFATDHADLWAACTEPSRLARWIAEVSGDLEVGGQFTATFTSGWEGTGRVERCEPPHRLVVTNTETETGEQTTIDLRLSAEGDQTRLVVEESGLPLDRLPDHGAGWHAHVADLRAHLTGGERTDFGAQWRELIPTYRAEPITGA